MIKKKMIALLACVGLVASVTGAMALSAGAAPDSTRMRAWGRGLVDTRAASEAPVPLSHEGGQTKVLIGREVAGKEIDVNGRGFTPGDYSLFKEKLYNRAGKHVGYDNVVCTAHFPLTERRAAFFCEAVITLFDRGRITVEGLLTFSRNQQGTTPLAITGGTGHFQNVRGEVHVPSRGTRLVLHLLP